MATTNKLSFWIVSIKLIVIFSTPGSTVSAHRISRATTDTLSTALDRLKAIARVTNGVYLTQEFINGTDHKEEITSELLRMGSVTPTQIANMDADELKTAIEALRDLPTTLNIQAEMQKVIQNMKAAVTIKENYVNIDSTTAWPEKDDFKAALNDVSTKGIADEVVRTLIIRLSQFDTSFRLGITDATEVATLKLSCAKLIENLPKLNDTVPFSKAGSPLDAFSRAHRIIESLTSLESIKSITLKNPDINATLERFFGVGDMLSKSMTDAKVVNDVISSRNLPRGLRKLQYTLGLPQGHGDLISVQNDVKEQWMTEKINSTSFEKSLVSLKTLDSPLKTCNSTFGTFDDKVISAFTGLRFESEKLGQVLPKKADIETALTAIAACGRTVTTFAEALPANKVVMELEEMFAKYRENVRIVMQKIKSADLVAKLTTLKSDLEKPENDGKTLTDIYSASMSNESQLHSELTRLRTLLEDDLIKQKCASIKQATLDGVETGISRTGASHQDLLRVVGIPNLNLIKEFLAVLESAANTNNPSRPDYDGAIAAVKTVKSTSDSLGKVVEAIGSIKGVSSAESKMLELLEKPKDVSDQIGKAVLGVGEIQKAIDEIPTMKELEDNLEVVMVERHSVKDRLTSEDHTQLQNLENLNFFNLIQELENFNKSLGSKSLERLEDSEAFFTEAKKLTGIKDDLMAMSAALDKMMALSSNSATLQPVKTALKTVQNINLDFASFQGSYDPAKGSMIKLKVFFAEYSKPPTEEEAAGEQDGESNASTSLLFYVLPAIGGVLVIALIIGAVVYYLKYKRK